MKVAKSKFVIINREKITNQLIKKGITSSRRYETNKVINKRGLELINGVKP